MIRDMRRNGAQPKDTMHKAEVAMVTGMALLLKMLLILLLSLILMVFGDTILKGIGGAFPLFGSVMQLVLFFKPLYSWFFLTFAFMMIYACVPDRRLRFKDQFPGALFAAVSWNLFSYGFSIYIDHFNGLSNYGSLSAIAVIMLWLYFCMYLLLAGAHLNRFAAKFRREW